MYVDASNDYALLGNYNSTDSQYVTGPPIISETKVQIVPSYGGVGFASKVPLISGNPASNYYNLENAYCCGSSTCQQTTQPIFQNVGYQIYQKK